VTRHPIQAEDGDMERVLILPVFKGEAGLPNTGLESINSSCKWNVLVCILLSFHFDVLHSIFPFSAKPFSAF